MYSKLNISITLLMILASTFTVLGQEANNKTRFSIELDPLAYASGGYSGHLRIQPKNSKHLLLGIGVAAFNQPDFAVNLDPENNDEGWKVRVDNTVGIFGEYHFSEVNKKWFIGGQISFQQQKIENDNLTGSANFSNIMLMLQGGYTFRPFKFPLYIKPWMGIGYVSKVSGEHTLEGQDYNVSPVTFLMTFHVGYTF